MASQIAELWTILRLESSGFAKGVLSAQAQAEASSSRIGQAWQKLAKVGQASALIMVGAATASVKLAMDFDQQMALIHTQAGASLTEVKNLSSQVLDLAGQVGIVPEKLAEGLYHVESAGYRGAEAMSILAAAAKDAALGQSDLEATTQAVIGVVASGIGGVKDAADAAAYLNTTVGIGDMRMNKLAAAIATGVLPSFKTAGLSMADFSAALATLTDNVTPADEAATRLRMSVALMEAPSNAATKALATIGLGSRTLANDMKKPDGLLVAIQDLKSHLAKTFGPQAVDDMNHYVSLLKSKGVSAANAWADSSSKAATVLEKAFGGGRSSAGILTLVSETDRLQSKYAALGTSTSRAKKMQDAWQTQQGLFSQRLKDLGASAEALGIKIGNKLIPPLSATIGWLTKHTAALKVFGVVVGSILVAAMAAWTYQVIANTAAMLANPTTWIVLAIVAAIALLVVGIYELVKHWSTVWGFVKRIAADVWGWLVRTWHDVWDKGIKPAAMAVWGWLVGAWDKTVHAIETTVKWIKTNIVDPIVHLVDVVLVKPIMFYLRVLTKMWQDAWAVVKWVALFAWGFVSTIFKDLAHGISMVLVPAFHLAEKVWSAVWRGITATASWAWKNGIKPTIDAIDKYGIRPTEAGIRALERAWDTSWSKIKIAAAKTWDGLKVTWGYIQRDGIDKIESGIKALKSGWDKAWSGVKSTVDSVWSHLKPIFDKISKAISAISGGFSKISPKSAGSSFAHLLGFDQGGWVPGPAGAPVLAVVHGGELVVSRDMLAGRTATPIRMSAPSSGGVSTTVYVQSPDIYLDGRKVSQGTTTRAQRTKKRNGQTFLS